jgi:hypothetical protein
MVILSLLNAASTTTTTHHRRRLVVGTLQIKKTTTRLSDCRTTSNTFPRGGNHANDLQNEEDGTSASFSAAAATPLFFAPKTSPSLTPLHLMGTASILTPQWRYALAPCLGTALTMSPFCGNLLRLSRHQEHHNNRHHPTDVSTAAASPNNDVLVVATGDTEGPFSAVRIMDQCAQLAGQVFFQVINESPLHVTKTKSMPAAYLEHHPKLMTFSPKEIQRILKEDFGIQSNRMRVLTKGKAFEMGGSKQDQGQQQWTGISLTRWMDLFQLSSAKSFSTKHGRATSLGSGPQQDLYNISLDSNMIVSLWLVALWESSHSKLDLLDFLIQLDKYIRSSSGGGGSIFVTGNSFVDSLKRDDPMARDEWAHQTFSFESDLNPTVVQSSMDQLLFYSRQSLPTMNQCDLEVARALEVVCAALALQQVPGHGGKPAVPNGYYGYDGGVLTAGASRGQGLRSARSLYAGSIIPIPRRPNSICTSAMMLNQLTLESFCVWGGVADCAEVTVREIFDLILWDEGSGSFDLSRLPPNTSPALISLYQPPLRSNSATNDILGSEIDSDTGASSRISLGGQEWFDLLSALPGCDYLETSPNGKRYELAPTVESLSKVFYRLLHNSVKEEESSSPSNSSRQQDHVRDQDPLVHQKADWTTLYDLAETWNAYNPQHALHLQLDTVSHRSNVDNKVIEHEIATFQVEQGASALDLRMRCDWDDRSGLAAVTHLRQKRQDFGITNKQRMQLWRQLLLQTQNRRPQHDKTVEAAPPPPYVWTLALALLGDVGFLKCDTAVAGKRPLSIDECDMVVLQILSTPLGCDRRALSLISTHRSLGESGDATGTDDYSKTSLEEQDSAIHRAVLARICQLCHVIDPALGTSLLCWILAEAPQSSMLEADDKQRKTCQQLILSLPPQVTTNESVQQFLNQIFDRPLVAFVQLRHRQTSVWNVLLDLTVGELWTLGTMVMSSRSGR